MDLLFFTDRYPYNTSEAFIENEIEITARIFERVFVLPCGLMVNTSTCRKVPDNVIIIQPATSDDIFQNSPSTTKKLSWALKNLTPWIFKCFFKYNFYKEVLFLISKKGFGIRRFIHLLRTASPAIRNSSYFKKQLAKYEINNVLAYSYWIEPTILFSNNILPKAKIIKKICRTHRWDLYEEENLDRYLPFQKQIIKYIDDVYVISDDGKNYLLAKYPSCKNKIRVSRLGTKDYSTNSSDCDGVFRIVSCSYLSPIKRVDLIIDALSSIDNKSISIEWIHFGGGQLFDNIKQRADDKLKNIKYVLKGQTTNAEIIDYYKNNHVNLFINVSSSEGIPVSIMEAISFGIPVIATDVGGTREIVIDSKDGFLLEKDFKVRELAKLIESLVNNPNKLDCLRKGARELWESLYSCDINYNNFYKEVLS